MKKIGIFFLLIFLFSCGQRAEEKKIIRYIQSGSKLNYMTEEAIRKFEKLYPEYQVKAEVIPWGQSEKQVLQDVAAGNPPGIAQIGTRNIPYLVQQDRLYPITLSRDEESDYFKSVLDAVSYQGKYYGLPRAMSSRALLWNKEIFKEANLDPEKGPETFNELIQFSKQILNKTGIPGYGMALKSGNDTVVFTLINFLYSNGGSLIKDGKVHVVNNPELKEVLELYQKLEPYSVPGMASFQQRDFRDIFGNGKVAMFIANTGTRKREVINKVDWKLGVIPHGQYGVFAVQVLVDTLVVFKDSKYPKQAEAFGKILTSPEFQFPYEQDDGLLAIRNDKDSKSLYEKDSYYTPFVSILDQSKGEPKFSNFLKYQSSIIEALQALILKKEPLENVLLKLQKNLEEAL